MEAESAPTSMAEGTAAALAERGEPRPMMKETAAAEAVEGVKKLTVLAQDEIEWILSCERTPSDELSGFAELQDSVCAECEANGFVHIDEEVAARRAEHRAFLNEEFQRLFANLTESDTEEEYEYEYEEEEEEYEYEEEEYDEEEQEQEEYEECEEEYAYEEADDEQEVGEFVYQYDNEEADEEEQGDFAYQYDDYEEVDADKDEDEEEVSLTAIPLQSNLVLQ